MISIAMTTHNSQKYLIEQLDSLRLQTMPADEVHIVDDASADQTPAMLERYIRHYGLEHWHIYTHQENKGYIQSFRQALAACSGDWIFLCDHDDCWHQEKLETMVKAVRDLPRVQAMFCSFWRMDPQGSPVEDQNTPHQANQGLLRRPVKGMGPHLLSLSDLMVYNVAQGCTMMVTNELARKYLACTWLKSLPHDYALNTMAAIQNGLYFLNRELVGYRLHEANTLGLKRQHQWQRRASDAQQLAVQKKEFAQLLEGTPQEKSGCLVSSLFERRAHALKNRQRGKLLLMLLLFDTPWPLRLSLMADLAALLQGGR